MDSMTRPYLRLRGITKHYGSKLVLDDVNLLVEPGELFVLLGPSGCGKSTLLNVIAGLERATRGQLEIGARDVTRLEPRQRDVAMVFQSFALYPTMSARDNIGFALKMGGMPRADITRRVHDIARLLQIEDLLDRRPSQLSGGQQQRVAIGRALVREPALFLLDEPLSNLDAKLRVEIRDELRRLHERTGTTTIYVTHDQTEAMTLATRIAVLKQGRLQQCGSPLSLYLRPANLFVASFVGTPTMKFIKGTVRLTQAGPVFATACGPPLPLAYLPHSVLTEAGMDLVLGIRPEHVTLVSTDTPHCLEGRIIRREHTGPDIYLTVASAGHELIARIAAGDPAQSGDKVAIRVDSRAISLFRAADGSRLN